MVKVTKWKKRGFTLSETLAAILIMGLVGLIVVGGFSAYIRSWRGITRKANAEIFFSTVEVKMQERIEYSTAVKVDEKTNEVIWFTDDGTGYATMFEEGSKALSLGIKTSANPDNLDDVKAEALVSSGTSDGMYATYDSITYDEKTHVFTITNLSIFNSDGVKLYQLDNDIKVRNVNEAPVVK